MQAANFAPTAAAANARPTLLTFALVSHSLEQSADILTGLMPLFDPVLRALGSNGFSPARFSEEVAQFYGLYINPIAVEDFISYLEKTKLLKRGAAADGSVVYVCTQAPSENQRDHAGFEKTLDNLMVLLQHYADNFPSAIKVDLTSSQLEAALLDFLVDRNIPADLASEPDSARTDGAARYLISRFILDLERRHSELVDDLAQISAAAMVSEVVLDLRRPPGRAGDNLRIELVIDAPVALTLLGLSGKERQRNGKYIVDQIKALHGTISVFQHSITEMENIIYATLEASESMRTGPLADALRDKEIMEVYVRQVLTNIDGNLRAAGLTILKSDKSRNAGYFDDQMIAAFSNELFGYSNVAARDRDAMSIAYVMRLRRGEQSNDPLRTKYLFITENGRLVRVAKTFCVEQALLSRYHTGPAIDLRRLAALLWVTLGSKQDRVTLSKRQLLANCGRAITSRPDIVSKMMNTLRRISPDQVPQLQYVLSLPRSTQLLMDATLGDEQVVNPANIEKVMQVVRKAAIQDLAIEYEAQKSNYEQQIEQMQREAAAAQQHDHAREAELRAALADLKARIEAFTTEQAKLRDETERSVQYAIAGCVREIVLRRQRAAFWAKLAITVIGAPTLVYATFVTASAVRASWYVLLASASLMAALASSCIIALWRGHFDLAWRSIASRADDYAMRKLNQRLTLMHLNVHLSAVAIDWRLGQVNWKQRRERDVEAELRLPPDATGGCVVIEGGLDGVS